MSSRRTMLGLASLAGVAVLAMSPVAGAARDAAADAPQVIPLLFPRMAHGSTALADGRVLVVGGSDGRSGAVAQAEVWDPGTTGFQPSGSMVTPRSGHQATLLADGRVLISGGRETGNSIIDSMEAWDPATGTFQTAGRLLQPALLQATVLLSSGEVLIAGGVNTSVEGRQGLSAVSIWDPSDMSTRWIADLPASWTGSVVAAIGGGRSMELVVRSRMAGGLRVGVVDALVTDGAGHASDVIRLVLRTQAEATQTLVDGGSTMLLFGESAGAHPLAWRPGPDVLTEIQGAARTYAPIAQLPCGVAVLAGGIAGADLVPTTQTWTTGADVLQPSVVLPVVGVGSTASVLPDGRVLALGGMDLRGDPLPAAVLWSVPGCPATVVS